MGKLGSLHKSFLAAIGAIFVVTALATTVAFLSVVTALSQQYTLRFATSQNELEKNRILSLVDRELVLSLKLVDDPVIQSWMADEGDADKRAAARAQLASYARLFRDNSWFVAIKDSGEYYVQSRSNSPVETTRLRSTEPADRWFFDSLSLDRPYWINVNYDVLLDEVRVWINTLVKNSAGQTLGIAGTGIDLAGFLSQLVDHSDPAIQTIVLNSQGAILAHKDRALIERNARVSTDAERTGIDDLFATADNQRVLNSLLVHTKEWGGRSVDSGVLEVNGFLLTAVVGYLPSLDWYNLVLVDGSRILSWTSFLPVAAVFLVSLMLILGTLYFLLSRLVLRPLVALNHAADSVASGSWSVQLAVASDNELGHLARSFNQMAAKIRDYTENLEKLVAERTRDLSESQGRLLDSIQYGRLIQASILPSGPELAAQIGHSFLLLKPLDTVGGDFCFFRPIPGGFCVAAVDCTGHGVPGAFMTMMVNALLNQVLEGSPENPGHILSRLDRLVQETLRVGKGTAHLQNGLDIGLCLVLRDQGILRFAGAGLPLIVLGPGGVQEIAGTRTHLGFSSHRVKPEIASHQIDLLPGRRYYLLTDGVLDLPGGSRGFGLGREGVLSLIEALGQQPFKDQQSAFEAEFARFQGAFRPKDDLLLFGFDLDPLEEQ